MTTKTCSVDDCEKPVHARNYCSKHYDRWRSNGDPLIVQYIRGDDEIRFESYVDRSGGPDACHPWTGGQCTGGYGQIKIAGQLRLVHIIAWEKANKKSKPSGLDIDHVCHNQAIREGACHAGECPHRLCCNPAHLVLKTKKEHTADTQRRLATGKRERYTKLTPDQVSEIKKLLAQGNISQNQIARMYNVHPITISRIKLGYTWAE